MRQIPRQTNRRMKTLTRRRWMSGLALAATAGRGPAGPHRPDPRSIDAHAHVWSPGPPKVSSGAGTDQ